MFSDRVEMDTPIRKILFCTDFSENADLAFPFALDAAARRPGSTVWIFHVIPEPEAQFWKTYVYEVNGVDAKAKHDIDVKIQDAYLSRVPAGLNVKIEIRVGRDSAEILAFAEAEDVDLIVMGRQGRNRLGSILFGSVVEKVARKAACPILIVPLSFGARTSQAGAQS